MKVILSCLRISVLAMLLSGLFTAGGLCAEPYEDAFKKEYPQISFDSMKPTNIKGIYEVVVKGGEIIYFLQEPGLLFIGEIVDKTGKSLTEERRGEILLSKAKGLPLDKAVRIGSGKHTVIEFTDPDCPYCRRASAFLDSRKDVTRYVFFLPIPSHMDSENKIKYIFCAADRAKAYEEAMKGKLDIQKYAVCKTKEAAELLALHKEAGMRIGVSGTPMFIINGKEVVMGANFPAIEAALQAVPQKP